MWAVVVMPMLLLVGGLTMEWGNKALHGQQTQAAADAAAKAAVLDITAGRRRAMQIARESLGRNGVVEGRDGVTGVTIEYGRWDDRTSRFVPLPASSRSANAVRVEVAADQKTMLASYAGVDSFSTSKSAVAMLPGIVMAVNDPDKFRENDRQMMAFLEQFGVPVRVVGERRLVAANVRPGEVVFISSSVNSSKVDPSMATIDNPVLCGEANLYDLLGFVPNGQGRTHGNSRVDAMDVEIDLYDMPTEGEGWREAWNDWWETEGRRHKGRNPREESGDDDDDDDDDDGKESKKIKRKKSTPKPVVHGWAKRDYLGEAVVISTVPGRADLATVFWFEPGARLWDGSTTVNKRAGAFLRTREYGSNDWDYSADSYAQIAQTIRWMLADQERHTVIVR